MFTLLLRKTLIDCASSTLYHYVSLRTISCPWCPVNSQLFEEHFENIRHKFTAFVIMENWRKTKLWDPYVYKDLASVEASWLLTRVALYYISNWSLIKKMICFHLTRSIMSEATFEKAWLVFQIVRLRMGSWCGHFVWQRNSQKLTHPWTSFLLLDQ